MTLSNETLILMTLNITIKNVTLYSKTSIIMVYISETLCNPTPSITILSITIKKYETQHKNKKSTFCIIIHNISKSNIKPNYT
jgi:hypothetical protein